MVVRGAIVMAPNLWCDQRLLAALVSLCNPDASVLKSPNLSLRGPRVLARLLQFPSPPKTALCEMKPQVTSERLIIIGKEGPQLIS